jgi:dipicolinate synthase subunit A
MMLAMEHTEITVDGMKVLIAGYGRIGAILASLLSKSGALVTVAARRDEVLCEANSVGYNVLKIDPLRGVELTDGSCFDVIFNTVPGIIFNSRVLSRLSNSPLYIEIASGSGGIDAVSARDRGIKIISAPSLPGKYAPITAGRYIYETIEEMCVKRGMKL